MRKNKNAHHQLSLGLDVTMSLSTNVLLNPEFAKNPQSFAIRNGVRLKHAGPPETSFKNDSLTGGKNLKAKANVHLVDHHAIRLFYQQDKFGLWLKTIDINPGILLSDNVFRPLDEERLARALSITQKEITPLLVDPLDACHIIPGMADKESPLAYWTKLTYEMIVPDAQTKFMGKLSHPLTGPEQGRSMKQIRLGSRGAGCNIEMEDVQWAERSHTAYGVRAILSICKSVLTDALGDLDSVANINETQRLVGLSNPKAKRAFYEVMSRLEGCYLLPPPQWLDESKGDNTVTHYKMIALLSKVIDFPTDEMIDMYVEASQCCLDTEDQIRDGVSKVIDYLNPTPVRILFEQNTAAYQPSVLP